MSKSEKKISAFAIIALVIGIISILISFIPFLNLGTIPMAVVAVLCGIVAIITVVVGNRRGLVEAIIGIILAIGGFAISGAMYDAIDESMTEYENQNQITLTADDISSIQEGDSYEDVVALLGEPTVTSEVNDMKTCNWTVFGYVGEEVSYYSVSVTFDKDVATSVTATTDIE